MPPKKKSSSSKKKKKGNNANNHHHASAPSQVDDDASASSAGNFSPRLDKATAEYYEALFKRDYPPTIDVDSYCSIISSKVSNAADRAYTACSSNFNQGIKQCDKMSSRPGPTTSRWHLAQQHFLEAIKAAMEQEAIFLKVKGGADHDHRFLLCKAALSISQCYGRLCDGENQIAWGRVAVAADPTYYNGYTQLASGLQACRQWSESLEVNRKAKSLPNSHLLPQLVDRIRRLERIVNAKENSKEWKAAVRELLDEKRGAAIRSWQECNISRPKKTCAMCWWEGVSQCSNCFNVWYCSRLCQVVHYAEHKHSCVATAQPDGKEVRYPVPDYPQEEFMDDENWNTFSAGAKNMGVNMIMACSNSCNVKGIKRALMEDPERAHKLVNVMGQDAYPIQMAAMRTEPHQAKIIIELLFKHGACPNVIRADQQHMLDICRARAKWIDDPEPSMGNMMFRLPLQMSGALEKEERRESDELVEIVKKAIQNHKECKFCRRQLAMRADYNKHCTHNMTDQFLKSLADRRPEHGAS